MNTKWILTKLPLTEMNIKKAEIQLSFHFPLDYRERIASINSGFPKPNCFIAESGEEHSLNNMFSLRESDEKSYIGTQQIVDSKYAKRLVVIGRDGFGNLLCYNRSDNSIVFWSHESDSIDKVSSSFKEFEDKLFLPE